MPTCRLCLKEGKLRNSHIVPEFLYEPFYNDKGHMMGINGIGSKGWKPLQMGLREPLFCEGCEQHFNEHFEKPFKAAWVDASPLPSPWPVDRVVCLGPHEERVRTLLLTKDSGHYWQYPVFGFAVVHHRTNEIVSLISQGESGRLGGQICHGMIYGGVFWWVCFGSHPNREFLQIALRPDGNLPLGSSPWNEVGAIQAAAKALRRGG